MDKPLVSIIIPLYNAEKFISATIESALTQTWENKEIIVIDDGSADNSYQVAKKFEGDTVKVFLQKNQGSCAARNHGLAKSKGDYIQYLDADDLLSADKIEKQLEALQQLPDGYMASCPWGRFEKDIESAVFIKEEVWQDMLPLDWLVSAWNGGGMMQTACWLTPKTLIEKAGPWNESLLKNPNDDGEFFCRVLLKATGIRFINEVKVYYRTHTGLRVSEFADEQAVKSLLGTCISYEENTLRVQTSPVIIRSLANNYARFIYRYFNTFPHLAKQAENRIKKLGISSVPVVGGKYFQFASQVLGFKNVLKLRSLIKGF